MENNGTPNFEQGSLHNGGRMRLSDVTTFTISSVGDSVTNFHVFDLDWSPTSIVWSVDGVTYETPAPNGGVPR